VEQKRVEKSIWLAQLFFRVSRGYLTQPNGDLKA
jgi:hypothetical protein